MAHSDQMVMLLKNRYTNPQNLKTPNRKTAKMQKPETTRFHKEMTKPNIKGKNEQYLGNKTGSLQKKNKKISTYITPLSKRKKNPCERERQRAAKENTNTTTSRDLVVLCSAISSRPLDWFSRQIDS
jgi:hypothetical protein